MILHVCHLLFKYLQQLFRRKLLTKQTDRTERETKTDRQTRTDRQRDRQKRTDRHNYMDAYRDTCILLCRLYAASLQRKRITSAHHKRYKIYIENSTHPIYYFFFVCLYFLVYSWVIYCTSVTVESKTSFLTGFVFYEG